MIKTNNKDMYKVIKAAQKQGWLVTQSSKHIKWLAPDGVTILVSPISGSSRSWANHMARMRRAGYSKG